MHDRHLNPGQRLAELVEDAAGDNAAALQREVDVIDRLAGGGVDRLSAFAGTLLSPRRADITGLRDEQVVAAGRQRREFVSAVGVRHDRSTNDA